MQQIESGSVVLVLGGVRSGKSRYAQQMAESRNCVTFVATAECRDDEEMRVKIGRHRAERPDSWLTIEEPVELARIVQSAGPGCEVMLVDCLTFFAANILEAHGKDPLRLQARIDDLCVALQSAPCAVILVSNEVGSGIVPAYAAGRRYRDLLGAINQRVAAVADGVVLMIAGLPLKLKEPLGREVRR